MCVSGESYHDLVSGDRSGDRLNVSALFVRFTPPSGEVISAVRERSVSPTDSDSRSTWRTEGRSREFSRNQRGRVGNWSVRACSREAEVCVAAEGHAALIDRAVMAAVKTRRRRRLGFAPLEAIPEECGSDGGCFSIDDWECVSDGVDLDEWCDVDGDEVDLEMPMEGVSWAVDVGLRGVCSVVSKSSALTLRRLRLW